MQWFACSTLETTDYWDCKPINPDFPHVEFDVQTNSSVYIALSRRAIPSLTEEHIVSTHQVGRDSPPKYRYSVFNRLNASSSVSSKGEEEEGGNDSGGEGGSSPKSSKLSGSPSAQFLNVPGASSDDAGSAEGKDASKSPRFMYADMIEIVLGDKNNTQSCIRRGHGGPELVRRSTPNILSPTSYIGFWVDISSETGCVSVGYRGRSKPFMTTCPLLLRPDQRSTSPGSSSNLSPLSPPPALSSRRSECRYSPLQPHRVRRFSSAVQTNTLWGRGVCVCQEPTKGAMVGAQWMAYFSGPGSTGAAWRFYKDGEETLPTLGVRVVFSFIIEKAAVPNEPFPITICGMNLPMSHDRLKVVPKVLGIVGEPAAGSAVCYTLEGPPTRRTGKVTFTEAVKFPLLVCYDPAMGVYEPVQPHKANPCPMSFYRPALKFSATPDRIMKPLNRPAPPKPKPAGPPLTQEQTQSLLERLSRYPAASAKPPESLQTVKWRKLAGNEDEETWVSRFFKEPQEHRNKKMEQLISKYAPPIVPTVGANKQIRTDEEFEEFATHFFAHEVEQKNTNLLRLREKYLGKDVCRKLFPNAYRSLEGSGGGGGPSSGPKQSVSKSAPQKKVAKSKPPPAAPPAEKPKARKASVSKESPTPETAVTEPKIDPPSEEGVQESEKNSTAVPVSPEELSGAEERPTTKSSIKSKPSSAGGGEQDYYGDDDFEQEEANQSGDDAKSVEERGGGGGSPEPRNETHSAGEEDYASDFASERIESPGKSSVITQHTDESEAAEEEENVHSPQSVAEVPNEEDTDGDGEAAS